MLLLITYRQACLLLCILCSKVVFVPHSHHLCSKADSAHISCCIHIGFHICIGCCIHISHCSHIHHQISHVDSSIRLQHQFCCAACCHSGRCCYPCRFFPAASICSCSCLSSSCTCLFSALAVRTLGGSCCCLHFGSASSEVGGCQASGC